MKILVINGPNLNMLGTREPNIYGLKTLDEINAQLVDFAKELDCKIELSFFQSNHEGQIIDKIQNSHDCCALIINPAAYTHTSIAIADAIKAAKIPTAEVHLSNISAREDFRKHSFISSSSMGTIAGFGADGYKMALLGLYSKIKNEQGI